MAETGKIKALTYTIQGSKPWPYTVSFYGESDNLKAYCSCPASDKGGYFCKHVASLLKGDISKVLHPSDNIDVLLVRASGSPLLEKAQSYIPYNNREPPPLPDDIKTIEDIHIYIQQLLADTKYWSEYCSDEDEHAERLFVYMRKHYKNGKPYKNPTKIAALSYEPIKYVDVFYGDVDENGNGIIKKEATGKRALPYILNSVNYGSIEKAGSIFIDTMEKLKAESY